jgi:hypothetical protein
MVKNMCFLLRGYKFKSRGGRVCIPSVDFIQSNCWAEGVPCPTNKGVSYTNLVWLSRDLKNRLLYYYYIIIKFYGRTNIGVAEIYRYVVAIDHNF